MEAMRICLNGIALSGLEGCSTAELWQHLSSHPSLSVSLNLDELTKSFIWDQMKETVLRNGSVFVYQLPSPRPTPCSYLTEKEGVTGEKWFEYKHPYPYRPIGTEDGIRGSCSTYRERKNITPSILAGDVDLKTLTAKYGESAVLVASQEVRERALFPDNRDCSYDMSLVQYCILEVVGASRHHGILRTEITKRYLRIDPRSTFHHCKVLESFGLLRVKSSQAKRGKCFEVVHLLLLPRHPLPAWVQVSTFPTLISNMLRDAPRHTLPSSVLSNTIGKGYKSGRDTLCRGGFVETVLLPKESTPKKSKKQRSNAAMSSLGEGKVPTLRHLRLLKPYVAPDEVEAGEEEEGEGEGPGVPLIAEMPIDMQGYRIIDGRGPEGINNSVFCNSTLCVDPLCVRQLSKALIKSKQVVTILVDEDGVKKIRLVSARHINQNKDYENLLAEQAKSNFKETDLGVRTGKKMFTDPLDRYRNRKKAEKSGRGMSVRSGDLLRTNQSEGVVVGGISEKGSQTDFYETPSTEDAVPGPSQSPGPSSKLEPKAAISKAFKKNKPLLTYHQLKRLNIISDYIEQQQIVSGLTDITEHLRKCEKMEGQTATIDKKTSEKLVYYLLDNGSICQKQLSIPDLPSSRDTHVSLFYVAGVCPDKLAAAEEEAIRTVTAAHAKRQTKVSDKEDKVGKRKKKKKKEKSQTEQQGEEDNDDSLSDSDGETTVIPGMPTMAKFPKLKHLHFYLWILTHGLGETTPTLRSEVTSDEPPGRDGKERKSSSSPLPNPTQHILPITNFPWVSTVTQLAPSGRGSSWLCYNDIIPNMPLSLFCLLMPTLAAGSVISAKYSCYFDGPDYQHIPVYQLPRRLRHVMTSHYRDVSLVNQLLEKLEEMGLLQVDGNLQTNRRREQVFLRLSDTVTILDTSVATPRRSFFTERARPLFQPIVYTLTSLTAVEHYWYQLQSICMRTPIILVERHKGLKGKVKRKGLQATPTKSTANDLNSLPYDSKNKHITSEFAREYNQRGFGAGGLPPLCFSHLKRNWYPLYSREVKGGMEQRLDDGGVGTGEGGMEWSYGPGMGLNNVPQLTSGEVSDRGEAGGSAREEESEGGEMGEPPIKKSRLDSRPRFGQVVQVPSHLVQRHSGGRGYQRARTKRVLEAAKKLKKVKRVSSRYSVSRKNAVLVMESDGNKEWSVKTGRERVRWFPHEDSFLLLAYLASHALRQVTGSEATVSYRQIRDALHTEYDSSRDKSMGSIQRRITMLQQRRKNLSSTVNVCLAEILSEIGEMGSSAPDPTFTSLLSFVTQRYKSQGGLILGKGSTLPSSLSKLQTQFDVVGWGIEGESEREVLLPPDNDEHSINQAFLTDLIIASLGAEEATYDHYAAFKNFESFPEADVKAAFDDLRSQLLIKRRRSVQGIPRHGGPLECQSFQLAANFNNKLEFSYFHGTGKDAAECAKNLSDRRSEVATAMKQWQLPDSVGESTVGCSAEVVMETGTVCGGTVACLLSTLFGEQNGTVTCEPVMPERLFETDDEHEKEKTELMMEGAVVEEEEGEEEEEGLPSSSSAVKGSRFSGLGLGSLLRVSETSTQNHGSLKLGLDVPWSSLLSPLPNEAPPTSLASWVASGVNDRETSADPPLSLTEYLQLCKRHLHMSEADQQYSGAVYGVIETQGDGGITKGELREHETLSPIPTNNHLTLDDHIQSLLNFEMIMHVGTSENRLVTVGHAQRWCMPIRPSPNGPPRSLVPYRAWVTINSAHSNETLMNKYRHGILTYLMANPGVTTEKLAKHLSGMLHQTGLQQILQSLQCEGRVSLCSSTEAAEPLVCKDLLSYTV